MRYKPMAFRNDYRIYAQLRNKFRIKWSVYYCETIVVCR